MVGPGGFEPPTYNLGGIRTSCGFLLSPASIDWNGFKTWCYEKFAERNVKQTFNYALKYHRLLIEGFGELHGFSKSKRRMVLEALANLLKFLGCYDRFKMLKEKSEVKWGA